MHSVLNKQLSRSGNYRRRATRESVWPPWDDSVTTAWPELKREELAILSSVREILSAAGWPYPLVPAQSVRCVQTYERWDSYRNVTRKTGINKPPVSGRWNLCKTKERWPLGYYLSRTVQACLQVLSQLSAIGYQLYSVFNSWHSKLVFR